MAPQRLYICILHYAPKPSFVHTVLEAHKETLEILVPMIQASGPGASILAHGYPYRASRSSRRQSRSEDWLIGCLLLRRASGLLLLCSSGPRGFVEVLFGLIIKSMIPGGMQFKLP